jgi:hypothetical protein
MALLRALPEEYNSLRATLFIQDNLNLQTVETAFLAEDNQRQHVARDNVTALRAFTTWKPSHCEHHSMASQQETAASSTSYATFKQGKGNISCYFCKNIGHTERECKIKRATQKSYLQHQSTKANIASKSTPETEAESNDEFEGNASSIPIPSNARSDLNADTGATRSMMSNEKFFSTLQPLVHTIQLHQENRVCLCRSRKS